MEVCSTAQTCAEARHTVDVVGNLSVLPLPLNVQLLFNDLHGMNWWLQSCM